LGKVVFSAFFRRGLSSIALAAEKEISQLEMSKPKYQQLGARLFAKVDIFHISPT